MKNIVLVMKNVILGIWHFITFFILNKKSGKTFNRLANKGLSPLQVDGYVKKHKEPWVGIVFNKILKDLESHIDINDNVLEIGCGTGRYLNGIKGLLKNIPTGIDISLNTIENYTKKHERIIALHGDFIDYSFDKKYDFIYSITVIEYIPFFRIKKFFNKLHSVLKVGGKVYINYPNSTRNRF